MKSRSEAADMLSLDEIPPRRRIVGCRDRMCGADDCPNCYPYPAAVEAAEEREIISTEDPS